MDWLSLAGIALGIAAIVLGNVLEGGAVSALINGPAALIVFGGTLGAVIVQTPFIVLRTTLVRAFWLFIPPQYNLNDLLDELCQWSNTARREGLIGLENIADIEHSKLAVKGLHLVADGQPPLAIRNCLEMDMYRQEDTGLQCAHVFDSLGGYAPTIGIIGAVLGLMQVLGHLDSPDQLGPGIATAFVATVYGVGFANIIFLPLGQRMKHLVKEEFLYNELTIEGLVAIAEGENPNSIRYRFESLRNT